MHDDIPDEIAGRQIVDIQIERQRHAMTRTDRLLGIFHMRAMAEILDIIDNQRLIAVINQLEFVRQYRR